MLFVTFIFISLLIFSFSIDFDDDKLKEIDAMINAQMKDAKLDTVGLTIINSSSIIYEKVYGDKGYDINSPIVIGSVTKSFTALSILKLNISLNDTLDHYELGEFIDDKLLKEITVGELLNHTSGLDAFSPKQVGERGKFRYSNYGYGLLGKIIEKKSGKTYKEFVKLNIFDKLGMDNSAAEYSENIINSYSNFFGFRTKYGGLKSEYDNEDGFYIPAGFIRSTIHDMSKYLGFYLDKDNSEYVSKMTDAKVKILYNMDYGLGMFVRKKDNMKFYEHTGQVKTFLSHLYVYPDYDLAFFYSTNTYDPLCTVPFTQFTTNLENLILSSPYDTVSGSLYFYVHFAIDIIIIILIAIPLTYLIISIVRKVKKEKPTWFDGVKGIVIFGVDILLLIILPILLLIIFYATSLKSLVDSSKDIAFAVLTFTLALMVNFVLKLIYFILYKKYLDEDKTQEKVGKILEPVDLDYMNGGD